MEKNICDECNNRVCEADCAGLSSDSEYDAHLENWCHGHPKPEQTERGWEKRYNENLGQYIIDAEMRSCQEYCYDANHDCLKSASEKSDEFKVFIRTLISQAKAQGMKDIGEKILAKVDETLHTNPDDIEEGTRLGYDVREDARQDVTEAIRTVLQDNGVE